MGTGMKIGPRLISTFLLVAVITAITGMIGMHFSSYVGERGENVGAKLAPLGDAAMEIKLTATTAHLLFEEILAGDTSEDINQVWKLLDETLWYCDAILKGGQNDEGIFVATKNPQVREKIREVRVSVEGFIAGAHQRYDQRSNSVTIGSDVDQAFDKQYENLQEGLAAIIEKHNQPNHLSIIQLAGESRFLLADGHLFLEELLAGDDEAKIVDILSSFDKAQANIHQIGSVIGQNNVSDLIENLKGFIATTQERYKVSQQTSSAGGEADEMFDTQFESFVRIADEAEELIHDDMRKGIADLKNGISQAQLYMFGTIFFSFAIAVILGVFISGTIKRPIEAMVDALNKLSTGDLTVKTDINTQDELGNMSRLFNHTVNNLANMIIQIKNNTGVLANSSSKLNTISAELASGSEQMTMQYNNAASATEEMSTNINTMAAAAEEMSVNASSVSSAAEQMSTNMNAVAAAIEEMSTAINNIAKNAQDGSKISEQAMTLSLDATEMMNTLGTAAKDIGQVTEVIKRIAEQTNLLALNATIEAASAGDAGKGFAVVANEIKELANQSAQAAEDITNRIEGVQTNTENAVKVIDRVSEIIKNINESVGVITNAVEQQTSVANDISSNVAQSNAGVNNIASSIAEVAKGSNDMSNNAGEAAKGADEVSQNIQGVNKVADETNSGAQQVNLSADELTKIASEIQELTSKFKVENEMMTSALVVNPANEMVANNFNEERSIT